MPEIKIDISELKSEGSELVEELAAFLKEKTKAEVETATNELVLKGEGKSIKRTLLRTLLRKFLHRKELREIFRVIGGKESSLIIKEIRAREEEE